MSVALGELHEWSADDGLEEIPRSLWTGLAYCKLGLSNAPPDWVDRWRSLRRPADSESESASPAWVAVVYVDWQAAGAPAPEAVIDAASTIDACRGVLFDTWDKSRCSGMISPGGRTSTACGIRGGSWPWPARSTPRESANWRRLSPIYSRCAVPRALAGIVWESLIPAELPLSSGRPPRIVVHRNSRTEPRRTGRSVAGRSRLLHVPSVALSRSASHVTHI